MSHLNRRGFLKALSSGLAATAALAAVDPEFLLWRPGAKSIFLPTVQQSFDLTNVTTRLHVGDRFTIDGVYECNPLGLWVQKEFVIGVVVSATNSFSGTITLKEGQLI